MGRSVFAERGYEATSVEVLAERAGVSNGTFYNYFDDREALVDAVVPEVLAGFAEQSAELELRNLLDGPLDGQDLSSTGIGLSLKKPESPDPERP